MLELVLVPESARELAPLLVLVLVLVPARELAPVLAEVPASLPPLWRPSVPGSRLAVWKDQSASTARVAPRSQCK